MEDFVTQSFEHTYIDKYNIAIGLINDIVEIYGMKVVIICNSEILGEKFVHDILRSKLNCIEYRKIVSPVARISMIDNCLKSNVFEDKEKQDAIKNYLDSYIKCNIDDIILDHQFDNLRLFGGLLEAFIITANLFDKKDLTAEFMNSLFNSIMIAHLAFYNKKLDCLNTFSTGANIEFLMRLFYRDSPRLVRLKQNTEDIKWIDIAISGYWILNLSFPQTITDTVEVWKKYKYYNTEEGICKNRQNLMKMEEYNIFHILYFQSNVDDHNEEWNYKFYIDNALKEYDLTKIEVIQSIVNVMSQIFHGVIYQDFFDYLFSKLIQGHEDEEIIGDTYIHEMYNTFRSKKTLH